MKLINKKRVALGSKRTLIAVLVISIIAGTGSFQVWRSSALEIRPTATNLRSYDAAVHDRINVIRQQYGRKPVRESYGCLYEYAKRSALRMAAANNMSHASRTVIQQALPECNSRKVGENIAASGGWTSTELCRAWFNSDGHRRNMLDYDFNVGAVYTAKGTDGRYYTASWFAQTN